MKIEFAEDVEAEAVEAQGASGVKIRMLIGPADDAPNFSMRMFEVAPGGHTPAHAHPWEHEVFVLAGEATVREADREHKAAAGTCVYVPPDEQHQFRNVGKEPLKFLCLVPHT